MSLSSAVEPLRAANLLSDDLLYELSFISPDGGESSSSVNSMFKTEAVDKASLDFDLVFVVAGGNPLLFEDKETFSYLRKLTAKGVKLGGISGGSALLVKAGVMQERRFTIHWQHYEAIQEAYPMALMERRLYVIDRDRFTCAGGISPLDMMFAIIASHHGTEFAHKISDWFIHTSIRTHDAPQRVGLDQQYNIQNPTLLSAIALMLSHIADPLDLKQIAHLANISPRQLQRLFQQKGGKSFSRFYRDIRLEKAKELLTQSPVSISDIAIATGFANFSHFSRVYKDYFGKTPSEERTPSDTTLITKAHLKTRANDPRFHLNQVG